MLGWCSCQVFCALRLCARRYVVTEASLESANLRLRGAIAGTAMDSVFRRVGVSAWCGHGVRLVKLAMATSTPEIMFVVACFLYVTHFGDCGPSSLLGS